MQPSQKTAKTAGILYLVYIFFQIFANIIGGSKLIQLGDPAATAQNILASGWSFRIGWMSELISAALFLLTAWALFVLLKPVDKNCALLFLLLNLAGVAVQCFSDLFLLAGQLLLNGGEFLNPFTMEQQQSLSMICFYLHKNGFMIAQLFFGAWLLPLGYLVYRSAFLPKFLGIIVIVHGVFWLLTFFQYFLFPTFTAITFISYPLGFISEFGLSLWLLIKGVKEPTPC